MSFTYTHDDLDVTDSFATPRLPDHDEIEDTQSFEGPITDPDVPTFVHRVGLGDPIVHMPMPGVKCPRCAERGIEQWVLPGKHCPRCNQPC